MSIPYDDYGAYDYWDDEADELDYWSNEYIEDIKAELLEEERAMKWLTLEFDRETYCDDYDLPWDSYVDSRYIEIPF